MVSTSSYIDDFFGLDELTSIFSFLSWKEILGARVSSKWRTAVRMTSPPPSVQCIRGMTIPDFYVKNRDAALALKWLSQALPKMNRVHIDFSLGCSEKFQIEDGKGAMVDHLVISVDGLVFTEPPPIDLTVLENFEGLQHLALKSTNLSGSYPFLFQFQNLLSLNTIWNPGLDWDLDMLRGLPNLEKLTASNNHALKGNLHSVRVLRDTLVSLCLFGCNEVTGEIKDLTDFPRLEELSLRRTKVTGDLRDIQQTDLVAIRELDLPQGVYGGGDLQRIEDAPEVMLAMYLLKKRSPSLFEHRRWCLADSSPQRYEFTGHHSREPPFWVEFIQAGPRIGWRWTNAVSGGDCEPHWFDAELEPAHEEYDTYLKELERIENVGFFEGFSVPPTEQEHHQLCTETPLHPYLRSHVRPIGFGWF